VRIHRRLHRKASPRRARRLLVAAVSCIIFSLCEARAGQSAGQAPSAEEIRRLLERMIANSHRSDAEAAFYARTEHWIERKHATDTAITLDRVYRVYPTGTGTVKLVVADAGQQVTPEKYRDELPELEQDLVWALDPDEPRQHARVEKFQKRAADRYHAVEGFRDSYNVTWLGTETLPGVSPAAAALPQPLTKLLLDPKPGSPSGSIATELLAASRLTIWVEPESGAVVRLDAELVRDLAFGGGLLGKIDKGGRVHIEQTEVAPGIWLPSLTTNEVQGRKLFSHEESVRTVEARDFRRVGPPADLLSLVRHELGNASIHVPSP
jgi:hypothetical protein